MKILPLLIPALLFSGSGNKKTTEKSTAERPNIVFIFTDDQNYQTIAALGNKEIHTPNMDRMVKGGTTFTHAYNMGAWNGAVCIASRSMIISGMSLWRARKQSMLWSKGDSSSLTNNWPQLLEKQGYSTYMTGKWHITAPADSLFQHTAHIRPGMPPDRWNHQLISAFFKEQERASAAEIDQIMPFGYNRPKSRQDTSWSSTDTLNGGFWEGGMHWSEVLREDALSFLDQAKQEEKPFFIYLAFNAPHDPRQAPREYLEMYNTDSLSLPPAFAPEHPFKEMIGNGPSLRDEALAPFPRTEYAIRKHTQEYYALISHLDTQIGIILDALEASGKMDNTIIFFGADHGLALGRHGLLGKQSLYDHSIRIPLIAMGRGIPKNRKVEADVYLQDIMATSLELAGVQRPDGLEFYSFLDLIRGERQASHYAAIYGAYLNDQRMIRKKGYKLILFPRARKLRLFDLNNDPDELLDLSGSKVHQSRITELYSDLLSLQKEMADSLVLEPLSVYFSQ